MDVVIDVVIIVVMDVVMDVDMEKEDVDKNKIQEQGQGQRCILILEG